MDRFSPGTRSKIMSQVRGKNTKPELKLRRLIWRLGYHYRLHGPSLPGKPDLVFASRRKIIFVHGCFWHRHDCPAGWQAPKTNRKFWGAKLARNAARDREVQNSLRKKDWEFLVVWSCQLKHLDRLQSVLVQFLGPIHTREKEKKTMGGSSGSG